MLLSKVALKLLYPDLEHSNTKGVLLARSPGENREWGWEEESKKTKRMQQQYITICQQLI